MAISNLLSRPLRHPRRRHRAIRKADAVRGFRVVLAARRNVAVDGCKAEAHSEATAALIGATGYKRSLGELAALRACLLSHTRPQPRRARLPGLARPCCGLGLKENAGGSYLCGDGRSHDQIPHPQPLSREGRGESGCARNGISG
jgi:hypothetical protein